ncbi:hypothetical protein Tco_1273521 [Tanacetum coccineum]
MLTSGDEDAESMMRSLPNHKILGRFLSLREYNSHSPGTSPRRPIRLLVNKSQPFFTIDNPLSPGISPCGQTRHVVTKSQPFPSIDNPRSRGITSLSQTKHVVNKSQLFQSIDNVKNMGFNESGEYKKTFIGSGVGTGSVQVLQGVEFEVEPQEDHTFEVEPHGNVDHVAGSQEVQTQDLIYYHLARDKEQHSAHELLKYREDSNEAAFAVTEAEKIHAHESLTFNNTVACGVISKWKAGLKDDMDARSDVYVLSNGCKKCSDDIDVYYWEYTPEKAKRNILGMEIFRDQSGNTLRVSQSRFYNEKLVQTLLEGHSILSLEVVYQGTVMWKGMTYRFLWILTTPWEDRSLSWVDQSQAAYMTLTEAAKEAIWLKGLAIESGFVLKIVACIATGALPKAIPGPRFQHRSKLLHIGID